MITQSQYAIYNVISHALIPLLAITLSALIYWAIIYFLGKYHSKSKIAPQAIPPNCEHFRNKLNAVLVSSLLYRYNAADKKLLSLQHFSNVTTNTQCIFAKRAVLRGSADYNPQQPLEQNLSRSLPAFIEFTMKIKEMYGHIKHNASELFAQSSGLTNGKSAKLVNNIPKTEQLDGFVVEIIGEDFGNTVDNFAQIVRRTLQFFSDNDPVAIEAHAQRDYSSSTDVYHHRGVDIRCLRPLNRSAHEINSSAWYYRFLGESYFITTFAPCYPVNHSRHSFSGEESQNSCFVLFQPEFSFLYHNISADTALTEWESPTTDRDRIRAAYRKNNREYYVPQSSNYPTAQHIVPPLENKDFAQEKYVKWWIKSAEQQQQSITRNDEEQRRSRDPIATQQQL
jgi:hypothetical protein